MIHHQYGKVNGVNSNQNLPIQKKPITQGNSFNQVLLDQMEVKGEIKLSKHAEHRLQERNLKLSPEQKEKLGAAVSKAEQKGVKDSLILMDHMALVVNVRNRTVITVASSQELKDNVFTNIDGAVIL